MPVCHTGFPQKLAIVIATILCMTTVATRADTDLTDLKVYSPIVNKGEIELEFLGNLQMDNDDQQDGARHHEFEFTYSFTDYWASSFTFSLIRPATESLKFDTVGWENTFQLTEENKYWLDFGLHIELELDDEDNEPNNAELRLLFRKAFVRYEHIFNLLFEQPWGNEAEESTELEYIWRTIYQFSDDYGAGFEAFGTIGEIKDPNRLSQQEHKIGPSFYFDFNAGPAVVESKLVWLFGLTEGSADHTLHWRVAFEF